MDCGKRKSGRAGVVGGRLAFDGDAHDGAAVDGRIEEG